jgi:hypothetical protein
MGIFHQQVIQKISFINMYLQNQILNLSGRGGWDWRGTGEQCSVTERKKQVDGPNLIGCWTGATSNISQ